jgi:hypothetical protein
MKKIKFLQSYPMLSDVFPKPSPASRNIPQWYKDQPGIIGDNPEVPENGVLKLSVKKCQAFFDVMAAGYIIKVPVDIYIDTTQGKLDVQIPVALQNFRNELITHHSTEQVSHMPIDTDRYCNEILRIHPTWMVSTEKGYSTLYLQPLHGKPSPLKAVEAIIDTDEFFSDGHLSFLVEKGFKGLIKQGTPMVQIIPFKRDDWEMEVEENFNPEKTISQRNSVRSTFQHGYKLKFWQKKTFK